MTELLIAGLGSATVWMGLRIVGRDPLAAARLRALVGPGDLANDSAIERRLTTLEQLGSRFPQRSAASLARELKAAGLSEERIASVRGAQIVGLLAGLALGLSTGPLSIVLCPVLAAGVFAFRF